MKIYRIAAILAASLMCMSLTAYAQAPADAPEVQEGESSEGQSEGESAGGEAGESQGGESAGGQGGPGGSGSVPSEYDAVMDITQDTELSGESLSSENGNENVVHVYEGAAAKISDSTFTNSGEGNGGDQASFYGVGATLLVSDGQLYLSDSEITSSTAGGTGVFAYGDGIAYVSGVTIHNSGQGGCGGIHAAGGGTLYAWNCDVETTGNSSAAIRSDRGGGTMVIDGGSYITQNGTGAIYCTADISVNNAYLYAGKSEAVAIEGKNTIRLFDCYLEGNMQAIEVNDNRVWNCIVYQSMSGDSEIGTSEFDVIGGQLVCHAGPVVLNTNTSSYITFKDCEIEYGDDTTYFLQVTGNSSSRTWGKEGSNGANCIFTAYEQKIEHDVMYDTISNLDFYLLDGSEFEGAIICDDSYNGGYSGDGIANVYVDSDSVWTVTSDSFITGTLYLEGKLNNAQVISPDGSVYYTAEDYEEGTGSTVTVVNFETSVDASEAGQVPSWEDYQVDNPF